MVVWICLFQKDYRLSRMFDSDDITNNLFLASSDEPLFNAQCSKNNTNESDETAQMCMVCVFDMYIFNLQLQPQLPNKMCQLRGKQHWNLGFSCKKAVV